MRLEDMDSAAMCFTRCLSFDDLGDAWANLASVHVQCDRLKEARVIALAIFHKAALGRCARDDLALVSQALKQTSQSSYACLVILCRFFVILQSFLREVGYTHNS